MKKFVIYTIPKSGTHFLMQAIAYLQDSKSELFTKGLYNTIPHYSSATMVDNKTSIFSTHPVHIGYDVIDAVVKDASYLNIMRHPLDVLISMYFFYVKYRNGSQNFNDFFSKNIVPICNRMVEHKEFIDSHGGVNFVYEDCLHNKEVFLRKLAEILELELQHCDFSAAAEAISIKNAKESEKRKGVFKVGAVQNGPFYRDGTAGQFKNVFDAQAMNVLNTQLPPKIIENLKKMGFTFSL